MHATGVGVRMGDHTGEVTSLSRSATLETSTSQTCISSHIIT